MNQPLRQASIGLRLSPAPGLPRIDTGAARVQAAGARIDRSTPQNAAMVEQAAAAAATESLNAQALHLAQRLARSRPTA